MEIIGHRGAAFDAPENTLASFRLAWAQRADAIECDVRLSKDGRIVAIHDADTNRTAGVSRLVADQTFDELRRLDVGSWKDARFAGEMIPTLDEILATASAGKRAFIEVKCGPEIVPELKRVVAASGLQPRQTVVISFSADVIAAAKAELPSVTAYWCVDLFSRPPGSGEGSRGRGQPLNLSPLPEAERGEWDKVAGELIAAAHAIKADGLDLSAHPAITAEFVKTVAASKLPIYVWTVNEPVVATRLINSGVDGIATDRPGWLRDQLSM